MAAQNEARRVQPGLPAVFRPDRRRVAEQTVFFLLLGQSGELGTEGMIGRQESLLAMEDRWIGTAGVFQTVNLAGAERELDAPLEGGVRVSLEIRINEVRNFARLAVQFDQVGPVESAEVGLSTSLVNAQKRIEGLERGTMDVESVRQQFADGRPLTRFVDGVGAASPEKEIIGQAASLRIAAEEGADIPLESDRKCRNRRTAAEWPRSLPWTILLPSPEVQSLPNMPNAHCLRFRGGRSGGFLVETWT
jgi:hypothetical protein